MREQIMAGQWETRTNEGFDVTEEFNAFDGRFRIKCNLSWERKKQTNFFFLFFSPMETRMVGQ